MYTCLSKLQIGSKIWKLTNWVLYYCTLLCCELVIWHENMKLNSVCCKTKLCYFTQCKYAICCCYEIELSVCCGAKLFVVTVCCLLPWIVLLVPELVWNCIEFLLPLLPFGVWATEVGIDHPGVHRNRGKSFFGNTNYKK